jgi:hypothetical protein
MRAAMVTLLAGLCGLGFFGCGATDTTHSDDTANDTASPASEPVDRTDDTVRVTDDKNGITLQLRGGRIHLEIEGEPDAAHRDAIVNWTKDALRAVSAYYGRPPVDDMNLFVSMRSGRGIDDGVTRVEYGRPTVRTVVGEKTDAAGFARDWVLTHEIVHTALPDLAEDHHWLEEGLATYVEPIARELAGLESEQEVWKQLVEGLPKGQPRHNDKGLDHTPTWGRTYWGGALLCTLADVGIRERTQNKYGLRDALKALVDDGWTIEKDGDLPALFAQMDDAVGVNVLSELYAQHANAGVRVDLEGLWSRLGIAYSHRKVTFDDAAPEAAVRRAITQ